MSRRSWLAAGLVIVVAATLTWFLVLRDDGNVAVGERLDLAYAVSGTDLAIRVPNGTWQLTIAEPTDELDADDLADPTAAELAADDTLRAPAGGALLRVAATYVAQPADLPDPSTVVPLDLAQVPVGTAEPLPLPIVEQPAGLPSTGWVFVIPGAADDVSLDDVRVRLGIDGATQTVSVTGASEDELGEGAAVVVAVVSLGDDGVAVGTTVAAPAGSMDGPPTRFNLPPFALDVVLADPTDALPRTVRIRDEEYVAAEDAAFVGVGWDQLYPAPAVPPEWALDDDVPQPRMWIVGGDERFEIPDVGLADDGSSAGASYVAVPRELDPDADLILVVDYDGLRQTLDLRDRQLMAGPASAFDGSLPEFASADCTPVVSTPLDSPFAPSQGRCSLSTSVRTPHLLGLGWAPEGSVWAIVEVLLSVPGSWTDPVTGRSADYALADATTTMAVDGSPAEVDLGGNLRPYALTAAAVFAVPDGPGVFALTIDSTVVGSSSVGSDGSGAENPEQVTASFSSTIELRAD